MGSIKFPPVCICTTTCRYVVPLWYTPDRNDGVLCTFFSSPCDILMYFPTYVFVLESFVLFRCSYHIFLVVWISSSIQNISCCVSLLVMTWFYLRFRSPYTWTKSHFSVFAYSQKDQLLLLCKVNIDEKFDTWWMWRQMQNTQSNPHRHLRENFTSAHLKNRIKKRDKIPKSANWFDDVAPCASGVCSPMVKPVDPKWKGRYVHTEYQEQL